MMSEQEIRDTWQNKLAALLEQTSAHDRIQRLTTLRQFRRATRLLLDEINREIRRQSGP